VQLHEGVAAHLGRGALLAGPVDPGVAQSLLGGHSVLWVGQEEPLDEVLGVVAHVGQRLDKLGPVGVDDILQRFFHGRAKEGRSACE